MRQIAGEAQWRLPPSVFASAISHGGRINGGRLRDLGQRPGIADWMISAPRIRGWIEGKTGTGKLRADQIVFRDAVLANGERYGVAHTVEEFFRHLRDWGVPLIDERDRPKDAWNEEIGF